MRALMSGYPNQGLLDKLAAEFPDGFTVEEFDGEIMGVNPNAFTVTKDVAPDLLLDSETERMVRELFNATPKAKVLDISFSPSFDGGTLTISGVF